jgi:CheY-like chemotaxis protein
METMYLSQKESHQAHSLQTTESSLQKPKHAASFIPVDLSLSATCNGRSLSLWTESACADGMFLMSAEFVRPRSVIEASIWLPQQREVLRVFLSVTYVQQTTYGYGLGVSFVGLTADQKLRWAHFFGQSVGSYARRRKSPKSVAACRLLVVGNALSQSAQLALAQDRFVVDLLTSPSCLLDACASVDLLLCDLAEMTAEWRDHLQLLRCQYPSLGIVLLSGQGSQQELAKGIHLGASLVIAKPCSHDMLAQRLRLDGRPPLALAPLAALQTSDVRLGL